jgi:hypothetical protein
VKLLQENIVKTLEDIGNYFLNRTPNAQEVRVSINKWDCINLRSVYTSKKVITGIQTQTTE